jgi:hypothetical protein
MPASTRWSRGKEPGVEPQARHNGCYPAGSGKEVDGCILAIADQHELATRIPAMQLRDHLARPRRDRLVPSTTLEVVAIRRS